MGILMMIGRVLFSAMFIYNGIGHFLNYNQMVGYAAAEGVPLAGVAVAVSGLLLLAGGLSILFNVYPRWGGALLALFLIPTAILVHNFWAETDPMMAQNQMAHFLKNISMAGAALMITALPHGRGDLRADRDRLNVAFAPHEKVEEPLTRP